MVSRRRFHKAGGALIAGVPPVVPGRATRTTGHPLDPATAPGLRPVLPARQSVPESFDPWVEVRAAHLEHNVAEIHRRVNDRPILAVIKNNGCGLGVVNAARVLEPLAAISRSRTCMVTSRLRRPP